MNVNIIPVSCASVIKKRVDFLKTTLIKHFNEIFTKLCFYFNKIIFFVSENVPAVNV